MDIRPVSDRELLAASRLTISALPPSDGAAMDVLRNAQAELGIDPKRQIVAVEGDTVVGACLYVLSAGHGATVLPPAVSQSCPSHRVGPTAKHLIVGARGACRAAGAGMIQALLEEAPDTPVGRLFLKAGFEFLALLKYLEVTVKRGQWEVFDNAWTVTPYRRDIEQRFSELIVRTYVGSLDCPALDGLRSPEDVIAGHKASGIFTPEGWLLLSRDECDAGVVLVNRAAHHAGCELVYMGAAPEFRGCGLGTQLVLRAMDAARRLGCRTMSVAVDEANLPAFRLYERAGFRVVGQRYTYYVPAE